MSTETNALPALSRLDRAEESAKGAAAANADAHPGQLRLLLPRRSVQDSNGLVIRADRHHCASDRGQRRVGGRAATRVCARAGAASCGAGRVELRGARDLSAFHAWHVMHVPNCTCMSEDDIGGTPSDSEILTSTAVRGALRRKLLCEPFSSLAASGCHLQGVSPASCPCLYLPLQIRSLDLGVVMWRHKRQDGKARCCSLFAAETSAPCAPTSRNHGACSLQIALACVWI